ncbi:MAG: hypothetical protein ABEJ31_15125 [Haloarculaceae archaeon]
MVGATVFGRLRALASARAGQDAEPEFACQRCGAGFEAQRQVCPECGGYHIDRPEW